MLGESSQQEVSFSMVEVEERHFGLVIAQHCVYAFAVKIVTDSVH